MLYCYVSREEMIWGYMDDGSDVFLFGSLS